MKKSLRPLQKNMLIVCEGEVTEPEYLAVLRKLALETGIWEFVEIIPKPRSEAAEQEAENLPSPHKSKRNKRPLKIVEMPEEADTIEQQYAWRQTPTNFVKEARNGLKDDVFEETWAVFDRNGHPAHVQAFQLAREPVWQKQVNIAFSSIAFEHWILLHFEKNATAFVKSECKNERGKYLECGSGLHENDCWGGRCVSGHLRSKAFLVGSTKIHDEGFRAMLHDLAAPDARAKAYENAAWLRHVVPFDEAEPYLTNPFTNVDFLVKRLLGEDNHTVEWAGFEQRTDWQTLRVETGSEDGNLKITISNLGAVTRLLNGTDVAVFLHQDGQNSHRLPVENSNTALIPGETKVFSFKNLHLPEAYGALLEIKTGNHRLLIEQPASLS